MGEPAVGLAMPDGYIEAGDMTHDDPEAMARSLRNQIEYNGGGIVLLHDIRPTTLPTLKKVLTFLHQKRWRPEAPERVGYQIVDLPTYFAERVGLGEKLATGHVPSVSPALFQQRR